MVGADIGDSFFAFDMLFACLYSETEGWVILGVKSRDCNFTGEESEVIFVDSGECCVGASGGEGDAKVLEVSDGYIGVGYLVVLKEGEFRVNKEDG